MEVRGCRSILIRLYREPVKRAAASNAIISASLIFRITSAPASAAHDSKSFCRWVSYCELCPSGGENEMASPICRMADPLNLPKPRDSPPAGFMTHCSRGREASPPSAGRDESVAVVNQPPSYSKHPPPCWSRRAESA